MRRGAVSALPRRQASRPGRQARRVARGRGEMADAAGLGPVGGNTVGVRIPPPALKSLGGSRRRPWLSGGGEAALEGGGLIGVGEDQHVVAGAEGEVARDAQQRAVPHDQADPGVLAAREVAYRSAVSGGAGGDMVAVQALWFLAEPDAERPRLRLDAAQRNAEAVGKRGHEAALDRDG